ncbi:MAG: C_GCAxxG_C_C family protein [Deltaproteobacteria bacterium]|nr:C_GCAxxG_C_C family protein [Deltaproteobacteria bacterium]
MSSRVSEASRTMLKGYNCAQSVLSAFSDELGLPVKDALRVAGAFGGGMACMGQMCGAVTGAFMTIGLAHAKTKEGEDAEKARGYALVREFSARFAEKHGTLQCRELIDMELSTDEGMARALASGVFQTKCVMYVEDAVAILEELLNRG